MHPADDTQPKPASALLEMVLAVLTPLFFNLMGRDARRARAAALQAIAGLETLPARDLLFEAQTIAMSVSAMVSLAESAMPDLPTALAARLRATGYALGRSADRNRKAMAPKGQKSAPATQSRPEPPHEPPPHEPPLPASNPAVAENAAISPAEPSVAPAIVQPHAPAAPAPLAAAQPDWAEAVAAAKRDLVADVSRAGAGAHRAILANPAPTLATRPIAQARTA